jgi:methionyl-tRNA formyltransferase
MARSGMARSGRPASPKVPKTVFLGTSEFAAAVLAHLADAGLTPALVLTRPDRPRGRGRRLASPPVAELARARGIPLEQPPDVNDAAAREVIAATCPEALVVCAFGALIKEPLLSDYELLNVHPSLLPRWRGAAPIERAIIAGDTLTGVSIMRLTAGLDSGPVGLSASEPILAEDTYGSLAERLRRVGGELLVRALSEPVAFVEQVQEGVTYAEKIGSEDRLLDPSRPATELERQVRALHPHIGTRVALGDGTLLGVQRAALATDGGSAPSPAPGTLVAVDGRLLYGTVGGTLELLEVQPPGGRAMDASSYLRGHGPPCG